jgi:hypothetical protein
MVTSRVKFKVKCMLIFGLLKGQGRGGLLGGRGKISARAEGFGMGGAVGKGRTFVVKAVIPRDRARMASPVRLLPPIIVVFDFLSTGGRLVDRGEDFVPEVSVGLRAEGERVERCGGMAVGLGVRRVGERELRDG